jgi:hypothetical protein
LIEMGPDRGAGHKLERLHSLMSLALQLRAAMGGHLGGPVPGAAGHRRARRGGPAKTRANDLAQHRASPGCQVGEG